MLDDGQEIPKLKPSTFSGSKSDSEVSSAEISTTTTTADSTESTATLDIISGTDTNPGTDRKTRYTCRTCDRIFTSGIICAAHQVLTAGIWVVN